MRRSLLALLALGACAAAPSFPPRNLAVGDYDAQPRRPDGHVDVAFLAERLRELGANTYLWLVWHAPTDWEDLRAFLPLARENGIDVWVYLVPPSESPPHTGLWSEPYRLDFERWGEAIARLSLEFDNLKAWVIDDFVANRRVLTPARIAAIQARAKAIQPGLAFLPLLYFREVTREWVESYRTAIDGVVLAYAQDRDEIDAAWSVLHDVVVELPGEIRFPGSTPSEAGDFAAISQEVGVAPSGPYRVRFRERDDFVGPTAGYHQKQLLLDGEVVWSEDVAGGSREWHDVAVELPSLAGRERAELTFRVLDAKGVSNFGVGWRLTDLDLEGLDSGFGLDACDRWRVAKRGAFEVGFGDGAKPGARGFGVPLFLMPSGDLAEFEQRHGAPATPARVAAFVRFSLDACRAGHGSGVLTYCLDKSSGSATFDAVRRAFAQR